MPVQIIRDPEAPHRTRGASMPIVIALDNGVVAEAPSLRDVISLLVGSQYLDAEDGQIEWMHRLNAARKYSMMALSKGITSIICDPEGGEIRNNYAAAVDDPDYQWDEHEEKPIPIYVHNERAFIISLLKLGGFIIYEREDSFQLRPHDSWLKIKNGEVQQSCSSCIHKIDHGTGGTCSVFGSQREKNIHNDCNSFAFKAQESNGKNGQGDYIDLELQYDLDLLLDLFI